MTVRALEPIECQACHKMIEVGQAILEHHVSYYPERKIKVHGSCHLHIHRNNKYPDLVPDLRQKIRWFRKKGVRPWTYNVDTHEWYFCTFMHAMDVGFYTEEMKEKIWKQYENRPVIDYDKGCNIERTWYDL